MSPRSADPWLQSWKKVELLQQGRYVLLATWVTSVSCSGVSSTMRNLLKYAPPFCSLPKVHPPVDAKLYSESPLIGLLSFVDMYLASQRGPSRCTSYSAFPSVRWIGKTGKE